MKRINVGGYTTSPRVWRNLAAAVLRQARTDACQDPPAWYQSEFDRTQRWNEILTAYDWFMSDSTDHPFAFRNVCRAIDLRPAAVRAVIHLGMVPSVLSRIEEIQTSERRAA